MVVVSEYLIITLLRRLVFSVMKSDLQTGACVSGSTLTIRPRGPGRFLLLYSGTCAVEAGGVSELK